jgi:hypothetical protein
MMAFLEDMVKQYDHLNSSKALRVLITYAGSETDRDRIFSTSAALTANRPRGWYESG